MGRVVSFPPGGVGKPGLAPEKLKELDVLDTVNRFLYMSGSCRCCPFEV